MDPVHAFESVDVTQFIADVRDGLSAPGQRVLPSKYLYDEVGSALFEAICVLPEYGLTRADTRLLRRHAASWVAELPPRCSVVELGSGSSRKTRMILEPLAKRRPAVYYPIDISRTALSQCERELGDIENLTVCGLHGDYLQGLAKASQRRETGAPLLVLFLGSTIGNFDRAAGEQFLTRVRGELQPGDLLFLSTDMVKSEALLLPAYDDSVGVTAAFNKNMLARINRELAGQFNLNDFAHQARWNTSERRIEMHLAALRDVEVPIQRAQFTLSLQRGETIKTEDSYKFSPQDLANLVQHGGYRSLATWHDEEWSFTQSLLQVC